MVGQDLETVPHPAGHPVNGRNVSNAFIVLIDNFHAKQRGEGIQKAGCKGTVATAPLIIIGLHPVDHTMMLLFYHL